MKEKNFHRKTLIIALIAVIVLFAAGFLLYALLSPQSIQGDWELIVNPEIAESSPDEAQKAGKVFYSFSSPGAYGDGVYRIYYENGVEEGTYKLSENDKKRTINLGTEDLEFHITGIKLFQNAKLTITYPAVTDEQTSQSAPAQDYVFSQAKAPDFEKMAYDTYTVDKELLYEWRTEERKLSYYVYEIPYTQTVSFSENGIMTIRYQSSDLLLDRCLYYAYTAKDGVLAFCPVTDKETEFTVSYRLDDDKNLLFTDDRTSSSVFSDAFFSDVTYYRTDRLAEENGSTSPSSEG